FLFISPGTTEIYSLSLHDALPIYGANADFPFLALAVPMKGRPPTRANPALAQRRQGDDAQDRPPLEAQGDEGAKERVPRDEGFGAVDRVKDPDIVPVLPLSPVLLAQDAVFGRLLGQDLSHPGFCLTIGQGYGAEVRLGLDAQPAAKIAQGNLPRCFRQAHCQVNQTLRAGSSRTIGHPGASSIRVVA